MLLPILEAMVKYDVEYFSGNNVIATWGKLFTRHYQWLIVFFKKILKDNPCWIKKKHTCLLDNVDVLGQRVDHMVRCSSPSAELMCFTKT